MHVAGTVMVYGHIHICSMNCHWFGNIFHKIYDNNDEYANEFALCYAYKRQPATLFRICRIHKEVKVDDRRLANYA